MVSSRAVKVLVTGASGFIGSRLVARLLAEGEDVRVVILPDELPDLTAGLDGAEIVRGDIRDRDAMKKAASGVSRIYHLAAVVGDWGDDALFQAINVEGTRNMLDAACAAGCDRFVLASSIVVYGWQLRVGRCDEEARREYGVGPYSRTKRESEQLVLDYHRMGRVPVTVVRPGNVYGPGSPLWVAQLVVLLRAGSMVLVAGGGGDAALAYVDNVVDVLARAGVAATAAGKIYNAVDGSGVTWKQYITDLADITGARRPRRSLSLPLARALAAIMENAFSALRRPGRSLLTTESVILVSSRRAVSIDRAVDELGYRPISYDDAMQRVALYLQGQSQ